MLAAAQGYAVLDREGTRIGAFVDLAGGDRIAIRHDGFFLWRRRLLPITTVANVVPDERAVVLTVEEWALATPAHETSGIAEEDPHSSGDWQDRIGRYVAPVERQADQADLGRDGAERARVVASCRRHATPGRARGGSADTRAGPKRSAHRRTAPAVHLDIRRLRTRRTGRSPSAPWPRHRDP
jgi:hypothetical protein